MYVMFGCIYVKVNLTINLSRRSQKLQILASGRNRINSTLKSKATNSSFR